MTFYIFIGIVTGTTSFTVASLIIDHNKDLSVIAKYEGKMIKKVPQTDKDLYLEAKAAIKVFPNKIFWITFLSITLLFSIIVCFITAYKSSYVIILVTDFDHACAIIKPYISEKEYYVLLSSWALMKSKEDHFKIVDQVNLLLTKCELT